MARVQFSAFINDVRGRVGSVVYSFQKGTNYTKAHNANPTQPNTARQLLVRSHLTALAQSWDNLTESEQLLWRSYSAMLPKRMSAHNSYIKLNLVLLAADHVALTTISSPPKTPSTPIFPKGLCITPIGLSLGCVTWSAPLTTVDFISVYLRLHSSFCNIFPTYELCSGVGYRPSFRFVGTARSCYGFLSFSYNWPSGARLYFKAFSLDFSGRKTPDTHQIKFIVP